MASAHDQTQRFMNSVSWGGCAQLDRPRTPRRLAPHPLEAFLVGMLLIALPLFQTGSIRQACLADRKLLGQMQRRSPRGGLWFVTS